MKDYQLFGMGLIIIFLLFILLIMYSTLKTIEVYDLNKINKELILEITKQQNKPYVPRFSL